MDRRTGSAAVILLWAVIAAAVLLYPAPGHGPTGVLTMEPLDSGQLLSDTALDLNEATARELEELPGIGPVLAERILDWRAENGPFSDPDELMDVSGIGPAIYAGVAPYITTAQGSLLS